MTRLVASAFVGLILSTTLTAQVAPSHWEIDHRSGNCTILVTHWHDWSEEDFEATIISAQFYPATAAVLERFEEPRASALFDGPLSLGELILVVSALDRRWEPETSPRGLSMGGVQLAEIGEPDGEGSMFLGYGADAEQVFSAFLGGSRVIAELAFTAHSPPREIPIEHDSEDLRVKERMFDACLNAIGM